MECYCGVDGVNKLAVEIDRFTRAGCGKDKNGNPVLKYVGTGLGAAVVGAAATKLVGWKYSLPSHV